VTTGPRSLYARTLGLRHTDPGGLSRLLFVEGAAVVGGLAALAEFASWWSVLLLPATVALLVKLNDVVTGARGGAVATQRHPPIFRATAAIPLNTAGPIKPQPVAGRRATHPGAGAALAPGAPRRRGMPAGPGVSAGPAPGDG
jgi:hypothetical protein